MRTIVDLTDAQIKVLAQLGDKRNVSRAALIRAAVDEYLERHAAQTWQEAFGLWAERKVDGLSYQQTLRDEWE